MDKGKSGELLTMKEQQDGMLEIMKAIHAFCVRKNIRYVLLYGSLLGAVRHNGFIPWDNDMDIGIPRPDYDRLLELLKGGEKIGEHYYPLHYTTDRNYHYQIIRICDDRTAVRPDYIRDQPERMGLWVDIFPIDGLPEKTIRGCFRRARLFINKKLQIADIYTVRGRKDFLNRLGNFCCALFPHVYRRNILIDEILRKTPFDTSKSVSDVSDRDEIIIRQKPEDYNEAALHQFEDTEFYIPKNWDSYLKQAYGDYMQLPPEDKRMTHPTGCKWI